MDWGRGFLRHGHRPPSARGDPGPWALPVNHSSQTTPPAPLTPASIGPSFPAPCRYLDDAVDQTDWVTAELPWRCGWQNIQPGMAP